MEVHVIGHTVPACNLGLIEPEFKKPLIDAGGHDRLAEFAGRSCYQSWSNPSGRSNQEYLANIIAQGHYSVLEHASVTFYVRGVSRALTHELIRHRHLSYSQLSQRFVDESSVERVIPPALRDLLDDELEAGQSMFDTGPTVQDVLDGLMGDALSYYGLLVKHLEKKGLTHKQARETARAVLPNMTETRILVTGNHRAWREFLQKRYSTHADAEIRELAGLILTELRRLAPHTYQDFGTEPSA